MLGHHMLTLLLFACAHVFNVQPMAFLMLAILNFSSPFMHFAKVLHHVRASKVVTAPAFLLFAAAFASSRCVLFPRLIVSSFITARERMADGDGRVLVPLIVCMLGLCTMQVLQFYWLGRILMCAPPFPPVELRSCACSAR